MQQNIVEIEVPAGLPDEPQEEAAGVMYEHNATALRFVLDPAYIRPEYRYYLEFVTVGGVKRTEYLTPDGDDAILFSLPVDVTAQMTALCCLNIVATGEAGVTEQLVKCKRVNLRFSPLENTEKQLCDAYAFSVNMLLEAIRCGTFKGDKGDKGDAYILTDADKTEIASRVDEAFYGLPLEKRMTVQGSRALPQSADSGVVRRLCVFPAQDTQAGVETALVAAGENLLAAFLDSRRYADFVQEPDSNYASVQLTLKPGARYVLVRARGGLSKSCHTYLQAGTASYWICHKSNQSQSANYRAFTAPADGVCRLVTTKAHLSESDYAEILAYDWEGLGVYEADGALLLQTAFAEPLRAVGGLADAYDFVSGETTRRTQTVTLTAAMLTGDSPLVLQAGTHTAYRYTLQLPDTLPARHQDRPDVLCTCLPALPADITTPQAYAAYVEETGQTQGVLVNGRGEIILLSEQPAAQLPDWLREQAPKLLYATADRVTAGTPQQAVLPLPARSLAASPAPICADIAYAADLSAVAADLESRLAALENTL